MNDECINSVEIFPYTFFVGCSSFLINPLKQTLIFVINVLNLRIFHKHNKLFEYDFVIINIKMIN